MIKLPKPSSELMRGEVAWSLNKIKEAHKQGFSPFEDQDRNVDTPEVLLTIGRLAAFIFSTGGRQKSPGALDRSAIRPTYTPGGRAIAAVKFAHTPSTIGVLGVSIGDDAKLTVEQHTFTASHRTDTCRSTTLNFGTDLQLLPQAAVVIPRVGSHVEKRSATETNEKHLKTVLAEFCLRLAQATFANADASLFDNPAHLNHMRSLEPKGTFFLTPILNQALDGSLQTLQPQVQSLSEPHRSDNNHLQDSVLEAANQNI